MVTKYDVAGTTRAAVSWYEKLKVLPAGVAVVGSCSQPMPGTNNASAYCAAGGNVVVEVNVPLTLPPAVNVVVVPVVIVA